MHLCTYLLLYVHDINIHTNAIKIIHKPDLNVRKITTLSARNI